MADTPQSQGIPEFLLPDWKSIRSAVAELRLLWRFHARFCGNQQDVTMMEDILLCPYLIIRKALLFTIVMQVRSLLDPPKSRNGRDNASLDRLVGLFKQDHPTLYAKLTTLLQGVKAHCKPIKEWGNRRVGHADLPTVLSREKLPDVPQQHFEQGLAMMRDLLQEIHACFYGADASLELQELDDEADKLLSYIRAGYQAQLNEIEEML
jgi:hypothetical protein